MTSPGGAASPTAPAVEARTAVAIVLAVVLLAPAALTIDARRADADRHDDRAGAAWLDDAVAALAPNAVVVSWWSYSTTLWYGQHVEGRLPGVLIADDRTRLDLDLGDVTDVIDRNLGRRPVYVIRSSQVEIDQLMARYRLVATGAQGLWHVLAPIGATP